MNVFYYNTALCYIKYFTHQIYNINTNIVERKYKMFYYTS